MASCLCAKSVEHQRRADCVTKTLIETTYPNRKPIVPILTSVHPDGELRSLNKSQSFRLVESLGPDVQIAVRPSRYQSFKAVERKRVARDRGCNLRCSWLDLSTVWRDDCHRRRSVSHTNSVVNTLNLGRPEIGKGMVTISQDFISVRMKHLNVQLAHSRIQEAFRGNCRLGSHAAIPCWNQFHFRASDLPPRITCPRTRLLFLSAPNRAAVRTRAAPSLWALRRLERCAPERRGALQARCHR